MKNTIISIAMLGIALAATSCARLQTTISANGGFFGSYNAPYIIRNDSGGKIMDVWILPATIVMDSEHGGGFMFKDSAANVIHLGGDARIIRFNSSVDLAKWHEYHAEFEKKSYQELYANP